ncbi:hypothetical protein CcI49_09110 [Frankia sp. CcI49]|uniref:Uncharacterized protein n=1 Tax=Parafrankia irregularis TaxID=795642 RepID=A0A0S4QI01_9ACTN|nr:MULTISPECIES: hypothetical protein [Frankiaceae]KPM50931.1 hypothetical protein ACG83_36245 [Frankia sp. R43]ONH60753.1 hypothetical protein CcI49_09110 [Frankia sp. CcI49]CUU55060.1 hypothetical protein Ga0074812_104141 [Parafrankia irregularis]
MGSVPTDPMAACLPVAIEIMTAYTDSADDPAFFWESVQRVMADGAQRTNPAAAMAELVLGLATLCGIALNDLADRSGSDVATRDVLRAIQRTYVSGAAGPARPAGPAESS